MPVKTTIKWPRQWQNYDDQTKYVYLSEQHNSSSISLSRDQVINLVLDIVQGPIYAHYHGRKKLHINFRSRGAKIAFGGLKKGGMPFISIPDNPRYRLLHTIVHEMTHCLNKAVCDNHGPKFCNLLLKMMENYEGTHYAAMTYKALRHYGCLRAPSHRVKLRKKVA